MKILIAGAGGLVGRHLTEHFAVEHEVSALKHPELDITDRDAVFERVRKERPEVIFNCAVLGVDKCERDPEKARAINVTGPECLASAAAEFGSEIVHFSTNYVFGGERESGYYTIDDEPRPVNIYGRTKLEGEQAVVEACRRAFIIRTSWVFGKGKDTFYTTVHRSLKNGERVSAITNMWAGTAYAVDLVNRVEQIIRLRKYGTYHVVNDSVLSNYEFALEAARIVGLTDEEARRLIVPIQESERRRFAPRPRYTPMRCKLSDEIGLEPMRNWQAALEDYIYENAN